MGLKVSMDPINVRGITDRVHDAARRGLHVGAEHILTEATRVVPLDEGTLQRSGTTSVDDTDMVAAVSYDTPYAVRQHEELDYHHDAGRTAKYLENPMTAEADTVRDIVAQALKDAHR